jgi:hypothetical protein
VLEKTPGKVDFNRYIKSPSLKRTAPAPIEHKYGPKWRSNSVLN